jgi:hypothetical protein
MCQHPPRTRANLILYSRHPGKKNDPKSFFTGSVNLKREMAENFFKLWIAREWVCITACWLWTSGWTSKGKILKKKNFFERDFALYIRPPDSDG